MTARRWDTVSLSSLAAALAATALVYTRLPDPMATHFGLSGQPNDWMAKRIGAWLIPALGLALWAIVRFLRRILPRRDRERVTEPLAALVAALTTTFLAAAHIVVLYVNLRPDTFIGRPICLLMGALWVSLGLVMPRVRRNPIIGVRTAWTLTSDENWARTHRFAGYSMVLGGLAGALLGAVDGPAGAAIAIACFIGSGLAPVGYSFLLARAAQQ